MENNKSRLLFCLALVLSGVLLGCSTAKPPAQPESKLSGPKLRIEDALAIARDYVQQHHVEVADSYIDSTRLDLNPGEGRGKFWLVTWQRNESANGHFIKGGQFIMRIYMDRTVEVFYGD